MKQTKVMLMKWASGEDRNVACVNGRQVFIAAPSLGGEFGVAFRALIDEVDLIRIKGYFYVPSDWVKGVFPEHLYRVEMIEQKVRDFVEAS
jgi:hypothetical protein